MQSSLLAGKRAIVTGAANGIGQAICSYLQAMGAEVHGVDKAQVDATDSQQVADYVTALEGAEILINCAGGVVGQTWKPIEEVTDSDWHAIIEANLDSAFHFTRAVVPYMKASGWGRIVTISSSAGRTSSLTGIPSYASAKAAQIGFTRQMAAELGPFGITVNCIAPGLIISNPSTRKQWESYGKVGQQAHLDRLPMRKLGTPHSIAYAVGFFCQQDAGWITGQTLSVDGGQVLI